MGMNVATGLKSASIPSTQKADYRGVGGCCDKLFQISKTFQPSIGHLVRVALAIFNIDQLGKAQEVMELVAHQPNDGLGLPVENDALLHAVNLNLVLAMTEHIVLRENTEFAVI
jgi:hypothetical protein